MVAPTVRTVLDIPALALVLRAGGDGASTRPVRWVAVSELEDPTPYLDGGELLLTTGLRLGDDDWVAASSTGSSRAGVARARHRRRADPRPWCRPGWWHAAEAARSAAARGPRADARSWRSAEAVSDLLAAAEYEAVTPHGGGAARPDPGRARPGGAAAVVARLSRELDADLVCCSTRPVGCSTPPRGRPPARVDGQVGPRSSGCGSAGRGARRRSRWRTCTSSCSRWLRPVGCAATSPWPSRRPFSTADLALVNVGVAAGLVGDGAVRRHRHARGASCGRPCSRCSPTASRRAAAGGRRGLGRAAGRTGPRPGRRWRLAADLLALLEQVEESERAEGWRGAALFDGRRGRAAAGSRAAEPAAAGPGTTTGRSPGGSATSCRSPRLGDGLRQGRRALGSRWGRRACARFGDLARDGLVGLVDEEAARGFADALLGPLESRERGDLVASVRAWLAHHGQWDAAATTLGVHRHTLRYRMRRVEELLGALAGRPGPARRALGGSRGPRPGRRGRSRMAVRLSPGRIGRHDRSVPGA